MSPIGFSSSANSGAAVAANRPEISKLIHNVFGTQAIFHSEPSSCKEACRSITQAVPVIGIHTLRKCRAVFVTSSNDCIILNGADGSAQKPTIL